MADFQDAFFELKAMDISNILREPRSEKKIDKFFSYITESKNGKTFMAKMNDSRFDEDEVLGDFEKIYRRFTILNKKELGEFFIKETRDILDKLYEDFEEWCKNIN